MAEKEASLKSFLTSKENIAILLIALVFSWIQAWAFALPVLNQYDISGVYAIFVIAILIGAVAKPLRLSTRGQAMLWTIVSTTLALGWTAYHVPFGVAWVTTYSWTGDWFKPYTERIPEWMGPLHLTHPEYAQQLFTGGVPVPWAAWFAPFVFYYMVGLMVFLMQISLATILRKPFVEIEKLTFPYNVAATQMIETFKDGGDRVMKRALLIGIILGVLLQFGSIQGLIWPGSGWSWWDYWGTTNYVIPGLPNSAIKLLFVPYLVALNYLAPLSVLFSVALFGFIWWDVIPAVEFWLGYTPLMSDQPGWSPDSQYYASLGWPAMAAPFMYGAVLGLGLTYLILTRKYWSLSLQAFTNKISGKEELEEARGENYPVAWACLIISAVVLMAIYTLVGWAPYVTPLIIFELILLFIAAIRIRGEFTPWPGIYWEFHGSSNGLFIPLISTFPGGWGSAENTRGMWFNGHVHGGLIQDAANGPTVGAVMEGYKIGGTYNVPKKFILLGVLIAIPLAYLFNLFTTITVVYMKGINNMPFSWPGQGMDQLNIWFTTGTSDPNYGPSTYNFLPDYVPAWRSYANFFIGAIVVIIITILRSIFTWIPFHPLGIVLAVSQNMYWNYFMVVCAFVLKLATIRIGGAKVYERYGVPIALGIVVGSFLTNLLTAWAGLLV